MKIFNLYIRNRDRSYNILHIDQDELNRIINAYNSGKTDLFINGERYWLKNLFTIKIYEFEDLETSKKFVEFANSKMMYDVDYFGKMYLTPRVLETGGEDVTRNYIKGDYGYLKPEQEMIKTTATKNSEQQFTMDIFISHSSDDVEIAEAVINLIRKALNIRSRNIRCTSLDGYRLSAGAVTDEVLRDEIFGSKAFIAIITSNSINSNYVTFELGARWGAKMPLYPLICDPAGTSLLKSPMTGINALLGTSAAQIQQFVEDLGKLLGEELEPASSYQKEVEILREMSSAKKASVRKGFGYA